MDLSSFDPDTFEHLLWSGLRSHRSAQKHVYARGVKRAFAVTGNLVHIYEFGNWDSKQINAWEALKYFQKESSKMILGYLGYDLKNQNEVLFSESEDPIGALDAFFVEPLEVYTWDKNEALPHSSLYWLLQADGVLEIDPISDGTTKQAYLDSITLVQKAIHEGEFYELNLSRQKSYRLTKGSMKAIFSAMLDYAPVPFSSYMNTGLGIEIASLSPERYLKHHNGYLLSEPIKGTRKNTSTSIIESNAIKESLRCSLKEQAENLMIVDLVRNDLNRVSVSGSERVSSLFDIQDFGTVYHMVSSIESRLKSNVHPIDAIKHSFPVGSMTGAPKIRVMEWIERIENYKRGIYSGAIGYIMPNMDFDFSVVIRTALKRGNTIYYSTGGAITSDSIPEEEWEETCAKCAAFEAILNTYTETL